ncbi:MAG: nodulation protein NfeD [Peptostreptococcaceae bacterium]|jgi:membrane-bound serine protease (ClpP class)|nr:nodulation protein NfeD [Peptostreptococcaceae bacterium]
MKKSFWNFTFIIILIFTSLIFTSKANQKDINVNVIKLDSEVNEGMLSHIKTNTKNLNKEDIILFEIDTYGGKIDSAVEISDYIISLENKKIAYINKKAISAGVLISISCDYIYMNEGSTIGSAETIPNTEKILSYWTNQLKTVAEQKGRDKDLVAAMADKDIEIENVVKKGKLLNLTSIEAKELKFIDGIAKNRKDIYNYLEIKNYNEIEKNMTSLDSFINFITSVNMTYILIFMLFLGIVIEFLTPGIGIGGFVAFMSFSLLFITSIFNVSGNKFVLALFALGVMFIIIEMFVPGFGVFGIGGGILVLASIFFLAKTMAMGILYVSIAFIFMLMIFYIFMKKYPQKKLHSTLLLNTRLNESEGYSSHKEDFKALMSLEGVCISHLRPSGKVKINDNIYDALTETGFIKKDDKIKVVSVKNNKIIVRRID